MSCYSASGSLYSRFYFTLYLCSRFEAATDVDHVEPHDEFFVRSDIDDVLIVRDSLSLAGLIVSTFKCFRSSS